MVSSFFLQDRVTEEIMVETAYFGDYYLTYFRRRDSDRVCSLERYTDELAAREGHLKWVRKDWIHKSARQLIREEG